MAVRNLSYFDAMQVEVVGDPLTKGDVEHARNGARIFPKMWMTVMLTKKGARLEIKYTGSKFRWRLDGYAQDGSDVRP